MKKTLLIIFLYSIVSSTLYSCNAEADDCGTRTVSGVARSLNRGPDGGCYYVNSNGNKSYVDRSDCSC